MGRDRPTRVSSAPRGMGLYRRAGRDGFFFVKNLAAPAKRFPGKIHPVWVDEQIKRSDGQLVTRQKEAEVYCHRRNAEIQEMLLALARETVSYTGSDLEGISRQLADQWLRGQQKGQNLQQLDLEVLGGLAEQVGWVGSNVEKPKNQSLDAVVVGALLLLGIGATFLVGENLNKTEKTQLSSGAIGAAVGLLVGYSVGKWRP